MVKLEGKKILLLLEFELTNYPPKYPLPVKKASKIIEKFDAALMTAYYVD